MAWVTLAALPLNSSGKIDRLSLPAPGPARPDLKIGFIAPRTELEQELAEIWSTVLKREPVGIGDNFFELGGHSLLATQVVSRVRSRLQVELPLRHLFESPTIEGLAAVIIAHTKQSDATQTMPAIKRRRSELDHLRTRIEQLSGDEIDSLLASALAKADSD
jgi:acyl carrier protein